jgi:uncharacterized membrane protein
VSSITQSPTNLATTTPLLFFTRWITYLCAPSFVFLAGTSVYLSFKKKSNAAESRAFLIRRGLWLMVLEFTVVNFGLYFDLGFHTLLFEVIAAIGFGFVVLGLLIRLSPRTVGIIGLIILLGYGLFFMIPFGDGSVVRAVLAPLFGPNAFQLTSGTTFIMGYPPIPWLGVMLVGFAAGPWFEWEEGRRKSLFLKIGTGALLLFVIVRFVNGYGEFVPWSLQKDGVYTFLSFMNVTKYPPSLLFCSVTLGIMFLILGFAEKARNQLVNMVSVYGRVPMFYFLGAFLSDSRRLAGGVVFAGIQLDRHELCHRVIWEAAGRGQRHRALGYLFVVDGRCAGFVQTLFSIWQV